MLVLSRKIGEKIVVGENVTIVISRVSGNRVTLGIEAPKHVRVVRAELQDFDFLEHSATESHSTEDDSMNLPLTFELDDSLAGFLTRVAK